MRKSHFSSWNWLQCLCEVFEQMSAYNAAAELYNDTRKHLLICYQHLQGHVTCPVDFHWTHVFVTLINHTVGHFVHWIVWGLFTACAQQGFFSLSASTLCITHVTFTSHLIKSQCYRTGCGQRCPRQTGPGAESGVTPRGNQLPQEAAWWGKPSFFVA